MPICWVNFAYVVGSDCCSCWNALTSCANGERELVSDGAASEVELAAVLVFADTPSLESAFEMA